MRATTTSAECAQHMCMVYKYLGSFFYSIEPKFLWLHIVPTSWEHRRDTALAAEVCESQSQHTGGLRNYYAEQTMRQDRTPNIFAVHGDTERTGMLIVFAGVVNSSTYITQTETSPPRITVHTRFAHFCLISAPNKRNRSE